MHLYGTTDLQFRQIGFFLVQVKQTKYFQDNLIPSGKTAFKAIKDDCMFLFKYNITFDGSFGGGMPVSKFTNYSNNWADDPAEWSKARYVMFTDDNNILGYTSIIPSQLKIIDLGILLLSFLIQTFSTTTEIDFSLEESTLNSK